MKPALVTLPPHRAQHVGAELSTRIVGAGETALLAESLLGFIASRECPGHVLLATLDRVPEWVKAGRVIVSGFHSPLEQQVLRSVLRRQGRVVKVLARGFGDENADYRPAAEECEALAAGRMLVITACSPRVRRTTRATALERNRLVLALASEIVVPYVAAGSPLAALLNKREGGSVDRSGLALALCDPGDTKAATGQ
ncbi:DNA-processing protein DprA [Pseudomonas stutzeri]|nr:DNA-processing protein DprA [Stutzerimonas stutzeri]